MPTRASSIEYLAIYLFPNFHLPLYECKMFYFFSIYLSITLSILVFLTNILSRYPLIFLSIHLSIYLSNCQSIYLFMYPSIRVYLSSNLCIHSCLFPCLSIYLSIHVFIHLTIHSFYLSSQLWVETKLTIMTEIFDIAHNHLKCNTSVLLHQPLIPLKCFYLIFYPCGDGNQISGCNGQHEYSHN